MPWTPEQVLNLAPDASAVQAAKGIANPSKWVSTGCDQNCVWGEAKGSAATPYQTAIDLGEPAFKCTCPSRKFPCKHGLGLGLLYADNRCPSAARPPWVDEWLSKREAKAQAKAEPKETKEDPAARAKRAERREDRVEKGVEECEIWLKDLIRTGFAAPGLASSKAFDGMAARLVDAQAPGLTRLVRQMGDTVSSGLQWQERLLEQAGSLYLLLQAHKRSDSLDEATKADMRQAIGWTLKKEELPEESKLLDRWTVLGQVRWTEDRITTQRSWLYGAESQRWAMVLAFSVAGSAFDPNLAPYSSFAGPIAFYPGAYPMRAAIFDVEDTPPGPQPNHTIEECLDQYATALSKNPWIEAVPFALGESTVTPDGDDWSLTQNGKRLPITRGFTPWSFLAQTGGHPCSVFGEWTGRTLRLLSAELNGRPIRI